MLSTVVTTLKLLVTNKIVKKKKFLSSIKYITFYQAHDNAKVKLWYSERRTF